MPASEIPTTVIRTHFFNTIVSQIFVISMTHPAIIKLCWLSYDDSLCRSSLLVKKKWNHPHPLLNEVSLNIRTMDTPVCKSSYLNNTHLLRVPFRLQLEHPQSERWMYLPSVTECNDVCTLLPFSLHLYVGIRVLPLLWLRAVIRKPQVNPSRAPNTPLKSSLIMVFT